MRELFKIRLLLAALSLFPSPGASAVEAVKQVAGATLVPYGFSALDNFQDANFLRPWQAFVSGCRSGQIRSQEPLFPGGPVADLARVCDIALKRPVNDTAGARRFFEVCFEPAGIVLQDARFADRPAFFTGYYEPVVDGALARSESFSEPLLAAPDDLVARQPGQPWPAALDRYSAARRRADGSLEAYPDRKQIELGGASPLPRPIAWVRDGIEAFMIQVQGSAAIRLADGTLLRVSYAGRNGHPYTSIGKVLVDDGLVPLNEMNLARLKRWVRENGQAAGEAGRALLHRNASFVFFSADTSASRAIGPIGGSGLALSELDSIAIDKSIWPYGLPFWIDADIPWKQPDGESSPFRRLLIAQDTGGAIIGPARADIYFGSGDVAGAIAGGIRHYGRMFVLLPRPEASGCGA